MKIALITGISGQDGAYLTQLLLKKGYRVFGTVCQSKVHQLWRLVELGIADHPQLTVCKLDLTDSVACYQLIEKCQAHEVYNFAAQSNVGLSISQPLLTTQINALGPLNLLEAIRLINPNIRYFQAGSAEMFGSTMDSPQVESTAFCPSNPYAVAKLYAHWMTSNYRNQYQIFAANGILFNHESPLRGPEFVTRKISQSVARIYLGTQECLALGSLSVQRDWGYAPEYVEGMWRILQAQSPDDYILASNRSETVRRLVELAFQAVDIAIVWQGSGVEEIGIDQQNGRIRVKVDPNFYRATELRQSRGNPAKAKANLAWEPQCTLEQLITLMVRADLQRQASESPQSVAT